MSRMPDKPFKKLLENIKKSGRSYKGVKRREHVIAVNVDDLKDIYTEQEGKCFYSQEDFELEEIFVPNSLKAISADRIDNSKSYSKDNIVLCKRFYNNGRNQATVNEVMDVIGKNKGLLFKTRCYLVGAIEAELDYGIGWREEIKASLKDLGIIFFDPCSKPFIKSVSEVKGDQDELKNLRKNKSYKKLSKLMGEIRAYDLRCVDNSNFIIFKFNPKILTCGSFEEIFLANVQRKPVFILCEDGVDQIPLWLFGTFPSRYFFSKKEDLIAKLRDINQGNMGEDEHKWKIFKEDFR